MSQVFRVGGYERERAGHLCSCTSRTEPYRQGLRRTQ